MNESNLIAYAWLIGLFLALIYHLKFGGSIYDTIPKIIVFSIIAILSIIVLVIEKNENSNSRK